MKLRGGHRAWLLVNLLFALPLYAQSSFQQMFNRERQAMLNEFEDFRRKANAEYLAFLSGAWVEMKIEPENRQKIKQSDEHLVQKEIEEINESVSVAGSFVTVNFYGALLRYDSSSFSAVILRSVPDEKTAARVWEEFAGSHFGGLLKALLATRRQLALNDWAFYLLTERVSRSMFDERYDGMAVVFQHFLLVQFGYDVRMAKLENEIVLLTPFKQRVFARTFVQINEKCYYIYQKRSMKGVSLLTYQIPEDKVQGGLLSLTYVTPLNFPADRMKEYKVGENAGCPVIVKLNSNLMDFYRDYPQMEVKNYAAVAVDKTFSTSLLKSLGNCIEGKNLYEQLAILLKWSQMSFAYICDEAQFGREKPFFIEENFFYPGNDCEDRAILFSYLVWHLLHIDVVLVEYRGHVATAVDIEGKGDYYKLRGKKFLVCDPTFIHAGIGQSMPKYKKEKATILLVSKLWRISKL